MLSLSDNEFSVLSFLVRNFTERLTIRSIAQRLSFSSAGVFNILKKLEEQNIVVGEKLGTGIFYSMNFENKIAFHLAAISILYTDEKIDKPEINELSRAKACICDKKNVLLIVDSVTVISVNLPNLNIFQKTEDELIMLLRKKDPEMLQLLKKGVALSGEEKVVEIIHKSMQR